MFLLRRRARRDILLSEREKRWITGSELKELFVLS